MSRRFAIAAVVAVAVLAGAVGGWLMWVGRSPFTEAAQPRTGPGDPAAIEAAPAGAHGATLVWTLAGHTAAPVSLAVSPDGKRALSGGGHGDGAVRVWDLELGQPVTRFTGHGDASDVLTVAFSPDGAAAVSAAGPEDDSLRVWEVATGAERTQLSGDIGLVFRALSDDGHIALAQEMTGEGRSKGFSLWRVDEGRRAVGVDAPDRAAALAMSPDGQTVLTGGEDGSLTLWRSSTGEKIRGFVAHGPGTTVRAVGFARAGGLLISSGDGPGITGTSRSREVILWDPETGVAFRTIRNATHFALADDGRTLAVAGDATSIRVIDVISARERARVEGHAGGVTALAFAPGAARLVSAGHDRTVRVWALAARQEPAPHVPTQ
jgi:WD40 repeat protein